MENKNFRIKDHYYKTSQLDLRSIYRSVIHPYFDLSRILDIDEFLSNQIMIRLENNREDMVDTEYLKSFIHPTIIESFRIQVNSVVSATLPYIYSLGIIGIVCNYHMENNILFIHTVEYIYEDE